MKLQASGVLHTETSWKLLAVCAYSRKVHLPARTFQLLARPRHSPQWSQCSLLHTTRKGLYRKPRFTKYDFKNEHESLWDSGTPGTAFAELTHPQLRRFSATANPLSFRSYMRRVRHPVAIITSTNIDVDAEGDPRTWRGATVSSFNSVALEPEPYVSFNIGKMSSTYDAIQASQLFAVHVLSDTPEAAEMAAYFAQGNSINPFLKDELRESQDGHDLQPFVSSRSAWVASGWDKEDLARSPPFIRWEVSGAYKLTSFQLLCEYQRNKTIEIGDHVVVIGKVLHAIGDLANLGQDTRSWTNTELQSLTYADGRYSCSNEADYLNLRRHGPARVHIKSAEKAQTNDTKT